MLSYFADQRLPLSMNPITVVRPVHATSEHSPKQDRRDGTGSIYRRYTHSERGLGAEGKQYAKGYKKQMYRSTYAHSYQSAAGWARPGRNDNKWSDSERLKLRRAVDLYGDMYGWTKIASMVGTKTGESCKREHDNMKHSSFV
eukprot:SAG22_NODE_111_length_19607_cov_12.696637_1_plen_143_part_00